MRSNICNIRDDFNFSIVKFHLLTINNVIWTCLQDVSIPVVTVVQASSYVRFFFCLALVCLALVLTEECYEKHNQA